MNGVPSSRYYKAVRKLTFLYGSAFVSADTPYKQTAATALATGFLFRKYPKLTDDEVIKAVREAARTALGADTIPETWIDINLFMLAMIGARDVSGNFACCRKLGMCTSKTEDNNVSA
mgnify:CR=1 FL=1